MSRSHRGYTLVEIMVVLALISLILFAMAPILYEPYHQAKIKGSVSQAKEIVTSCNLVRVGPTSSTLESSNQKVTNVFHSQYTNWTEVSTLKSLLADGQKLPSLNGLGRPYLFKMTADTCLVAVELDETITAWEGYQVETSDGRSKIIVGVEARRSAGPQWLGVQKRLLNAEEIR
ncbi:type II secretion system protein [Pseudomonas syringae]|uniref:type II secretion system protein n=1 Tax=Pseudomonas syringae TaxID=317 RepID=UPI001F9CA785|nr:prepilin-type N-terminal cleavage/methylation domain-containing protein [Pseudomonas syringae]